MVPGLGAQQHLRRPALALRSSREGLALQLQHPCLRITRPVRRVKRLPLGRRARQMSLHR